MRVHFYNQEVEKKEGKVALVRRKRIVDVDDGTPREEVLNLILEAGFVLGPKDPVLFEVK